MARVPTPSVEGAQGPPGARSIGGKALRLGRMFRVVTTGACAESPVSLERSPVPSSATEGAGSFPILGTDFVEVLALFVRTIPLYPDGHGRVVAVSDRLQDTSSALSEPQVIEVADRGLIVNGKERAELPPGLKALREALLATAVVRVIFQPTTPAASYVAFARSIQRNARLAGSAHLAFADLWMSPIPGIEVRELVFGAEGFNGGGDAKNATDTMEILGSSAGDEGRSSDAASAPRDPDRADEATRDREPVRERRRERAAPAASRELRELVLDDPMLAARLGELERHLVGDGARKSSLGADVLEHLVRALPIDARLDSAKGLEIVRRVVARLLAQPQAPPRPGSTPDLQARFFQTLESVFPRRIRGPLGAPASAAAPDFRAESSPFDELLVLDDALLDEWSGQGNDEPPPIPELTADDGIVDPSSVLLHALLEEPAGARRDALHEALVAAYAVRSKLAPPPCILTHLTEALATVPKDAARVAFLASLVDEARLEFRSGSSPITFDVAVTLFPSCLSTYVRGGGRAGAVARRVGRDAVLAAAPRLTAAGGALTGDCLDRVLADRSTDALPFVEALLGADPTSRSRAVRALRVLDLKSLAAVALRVVPDSRLADGFLKSLCADGFEGADSRSLLPEAAAALGRVVLDKEGVLDVQTRVYATAALGSFPAQLAEPTLRAVAARKFLGGAPKEIRRAAEDVLGRLARAAANARPVP